MKRTAKFIPIAFTVIGLTVAGIWFALLIMGELGVIGNLIFLGAAAWLFELYSAAQRASFRTKTRDLQGMGHRLEELEQDYNL